MEDNIEYKVTVMSFIQAQAEGATILGEREYMFQDGKGKKVLSDTFARVGSGKDAVYGRKIVVDLPDKKGRATGAFYFTKGRLISLEATVLPANGNLASPDPGRFIEFHRVRALAHRPGCRRARDAAARLEAFRSGRHTQFAVIARLDRAIQYTPTASTGLPGQAGQ